MSGELGARSGQAPAGIGLPQASLPFIQPSEFEEKR
jgi:hypothetical protein